MGLIRARTKVGPIGWIVASRLASLQRSKGRFGPTSARGPTAYCIGPLGTPTRSGTFGFQAHPVGISSVLLAERRLTRNDLVLLSTLYDPRLARGPRDEVMDRARTIVAEHVRGVQRSRDPVAALSQR